MMTAKLFENGRSQAVRLPKEFRFNGNEVSINKVGDAVILLPRENKWSGFLSGLDLNSLRYRCVNHYEVYVGYQYLHLCH